jgi:hypothetical protein
VIGNGAVSREGGRLSVRTAIPRTILMVLGCVLLAVPSAAICAGWLLTLTETSPATPLAFVIFSRLLSLPIFLICVAGVVLFGGGLIFFLGRLLTFWRPILEVDAHGILDRASAVSVGFLRWEEVKDVRFANIYGQRYMSIRLENEQQVLARQNPLKRLLMRINRRYFTKTTANVPMNILAITEEELLTEVQSHLDAPARERLTKILEEERAARAKNEQMIRASRSRSTPSSTAVLIVKAVARWIAGAVLSLVYLAASILCPYPLGDCSPGMG